MKYATRISPNGVTEIVSADGKVLGNGDVTQRVFHILPKLYLQPSEAEDLAIRDYNYVELEISSTLGVSLVPEGGVFVRQPYPNRRYFVGGSKDLRNGWVIPIPDNLNEFDLRFRWICHKTWGATDTDDWEVHHLLHIVLNPGSGNTFSMDTMCWGGPERKGPITSPFGVHHQGDFNGRQVISAGLLVPPGVYQYLGNGFSLEEKLVISGQKLDQVWSIDAFDEEQLHEVRQCLDFKTGCDQHIKNTSTEFPAEIFVKAVDLARSIPYDAKSVFGQRVAGQRGGREQHPACELMAQWWADNRPHKTAHEVGFAIPYVRVRDDGQYWCGDYEAPNESLEIFEDDASAQARIGDVVLLVFCASHIHSIADDEGIHTMLANGSPYSCIGMPAESLNNGECDEAYRSLDALSGFPDRFPVAWKYISDQAGQMLRGGVASVY